jgi:uncharacterized membrane protein
LRGSSFAALAAALAGCAGCTGSNSGWRAAPTYQALGHEPAWTLMMRGPQLKFAGAEPQTLIELTAPIAQPTATGRRYATQRLTLDIVPKPCNDAMSGVAFADTVTVTVDGYSYHGCGGKRVPMLDV